METNEQKLSKMWIDFPDADSAILNVNGGGMKNLKDITILSFAADEFIMVCPHLREDLSNDQLAEIKVELLYMMVKAVKAEIGYLGIVPPNKIIVNNQDIFDRVNTLVEFEKANGFGALNDRAMKELRKAINGTYKTWIK